MAYDSAQLDTLEKSLLGQLQKPQGILGQLDPMKLALAQGFFAPTKTGGFGESVSNAVGALQGPLKTMADQNSSIQDKIMQIKLAQAKLSGRSPEDAEEARDNRQNKQLQHQAIQSQIHALELKQMKTPEDDVATHQKLESLIDQLRKEQATVIGRQPSQPQTAQPGVSGVPTIKNDAGEVMVLKDGKWVKQ